MKRSLALLLALVMVLALTACDRGRSRSRDDDEDETTESTLNAGAESGTDSTDGIITEGGSTPVERPLGTDPTEETDPPKEEPVQGEAEYVPGTRDDDSWSSSYMNLGFDLPDDMIFASEDYMESALSAGAALVDPNGSLDYSSFTSIYEFMAYNAQSESVQVICEVVGAFMDEERYISAVQSQLSATGITYEFSETDYLNIGEDEFLVLAAEADYSGVTLCQIYACRKIGERMASIVITATDGDKAIELLDHFS